jgi:hypothetical protein
LKLREGAPDPRPWPLALDDAWPHVRLDGADHLAWWIPDWPSVPVEAGWWEALTLQCEAPLVTIAVVLEPVSIKLAKAQARRRLTGDLADVETRTKHQMIETSEDRARRWQGEREEQELAEGHSAWRGARCACRRRRFRGPRARSARRSRRRNVLVSLPSDGRARSPAACRIRLRVQID